MLQTLVSCMIRSVIRPPGLAESGTFSAPHHCHRLGLRLNVHPVVAAVLDEQLVSVLDEL